MLRQRFALLVLLLVGLVGSGCVVSKNPISGNSRAYGYTWAQERQIGQEADPQIVAQFGLYGDEALQAYVTRIGEQVLAQSHLRRPDTEPEFRNTPFTFRVLDSPVVNAFALPGGYVYVTRGLLAHLENEAQLAVVLGHEIAHVAARHASKRAAGAQLAQIGLIGGAILGQELLGLPGQDLLNLGSTATQLLFLRYGRDDERQSDQLGVEYAALAGYKAEEAAAFFETLKRIGEKSDGKLPTFLSTHPDPGEREQTIRSLAAEWQQKGVPMTEVDQDALYRHIEGIVLGEDPRQGFVENGTFYHPELRFQFPVPSGYQVVNQPTQVVMVEPQQQALLGLTLAQGSSAQGAATAFARQQGLTVRESGPTRVGNLPAYFVLADAQSQQGQVLRLLTYFVEYGNRVYTFQAVSTQQAFARYQDTFLRSIQGFRPVSDPRILGMQPARLEIVRAGRSQPFSAFVPATLPRSLTPEDLAILNHLRLNETVPQGAALKLPAR